MKISGFLSQSFQDYEGGLSSVVFTPGCNYKCPACHASSFVFGDSNYDMDAILKLLDRKKDYVKKLVITGGEPTLQSDLVAFIRDAKRIGLAVKLDTNGSINSVLQELLRERDLVDYVAMDVKGPPYLYEKIIGKTIDLRDDVEKGMSIVTRFPDYEFRTTVVPINRTDNGKNAINFMTVEEAADMAQWMVRVTGSNQHKHYLQPFVPRKGELVDSRLEDFPETPLGLLNEMQREISKYLPNCKVR